MCLAEELTLKQPHPGDFNPDPISYKYDALTSVYKTRNGQASSNAS